MYSKIANNLNQFRLVNPKTIVPSPDEDDYQLGFIRRYFCQKSNDSHSYIFEIDEEEHRKLEQSPLWKVVDIKWRINGPLDKMYDEVGNITDIGIRESNKAAINLAALKIKNISLYLPNILQFYK
jgi:hypothetical protein